MKTSAFVKALMLAGLAAAQIDASGNGDSGVAKRQEIANITPGPSLNLTDEEIASQGDPGDLRRIDKRQDEPVIADIQPGGRENLTDEEIANQGDPGDLRRIDKRAPVDLELDVEVDDGDDEEENDGEDRDRPQIGGGRGSRRRSPQDTQTVNVGGLGSAGNSTDALEGSDTRRIHRGGNGKRQDSQTVNVGDLVGGAGNSTDPSQLEGSQTRRIGWPREKREEGAGADESQAGASARVGGHRGGRLPIGRRMRFGKRNDA
ncbi:hypothetical protein SLS57_005999 [Botryosphaeria dothidea]